MCLTLHPSLLDRVDVHCERCGKYIRLKNGLEEAKNLVGNRMTVYRTSVSSDEREPQASGRDGSKVGGWCSRPSCHCHMHMMPDSERQCCRLIASSDRAEAGRTTPKLLGPRSAVPYLCKLAQTVPQGSLCVAWFYRTPSIVLAPSPRPPFFRSFMRALKALPGSPCPP